MRALDARNTVNPRLNLIPEAIGLLRRFKLHCMLIPTSRSYLIDRGEGSK
jgi:hypothetical protein